MDAVESFEKIGSEKPAIAARPWFAVGVAARHEKSVSRILQHKGFETFLPLYVNRHQYGKRAREFELPLFPGYVFCRIHAHGRLPVLTTPGVRQVVGAGREPIALDEAEIAAIEKAARSKARMCPYPHWKTGQKGRVTGGALAGLEGIVISVRQPVKLVLSVSLLQRSVLLEIDADCVGVA